MNNIFIYLFCLRNECTTYTIAYTLDSQIEIFPMPRIIKKREKNLMNYYRSSFVLCKFMQMSEELKLKNIFRFLFLLHLSWTHLDREGRTPNTGKIHWDSNEIIERADNISSCTSHVFDLTKKKEKIFREEEKKIKQKYVKSHDRTMS